MPDHISKLSDAELADRLGRVDLRLRQMENWSPEMDRLDELLAQIREEMETRRMKERAGNAQ
jgi:hypothetical protein